MAVTFLQGVNAHCCFGTCPTRHVCNLFQEPWQRHSSPGFQKKGICLLPCLSAISQGPRVPQPSRSPRAGFLSVVLPSGYLHSHTASSSCSSLIIVPRLVKRMSVITVIWGQSTHLWLQLLAVAWQNQLQILLSYKFCIILHYRGGEKQSMKKLAKKGLVLHLLGKYLVVAHCIAAQE